MRNSLGYSLPASSTARLIASAWIAATLLSPGCGGERREHASPVAPSRSSNPLGAAPFAPAPTGATGSAPGPSAASRSLPVSLPAEGAQGRLLVAFPPRNESFQFRQELERKYRDGLRRPAGLTFVDAEGEVVWTQEYLRYRVNGCDHTDAVQRVMQQVAGGAAGAVCADLSARVVAFPPRDQSYAFRVALEERYRDVMGRSPVSTSVDVEGAIVWTQEYLRYRVNACSHGIAVARVMQQIDGGPAGAVCAFEEVEGDPLTGRWVGTSDYPNAPFTMDIQLRADGLVSGWYQDQKDWGSVDADYDGGSDIRFHIYFGDTGFFMNGRFDSPDSIRGTFRVAALGNREFWFQMRR